MTDEPHRLEGVQCRYCQEVGMIVVEWREEMQAKPLGTWSLAGNSAKVCVNVRRWPWARCTRCGHESRGQPA